MDLRDQVRLGDVQQVVVILDKFFEALELLAPIVILLQTVRLNLSAHSTVKNDDALCEDFSQVGPHLLDLKVVRCDILTLQAALLFNHLCFLTWFVS